MNRAEAKRRQAGEIAGILALAVVLVVGRLTGENGAAYVIAAVEVYALVWSIAGGGVSDTLGRLLRGRRNKGQYKNVVQMRRSAMLLHAASGIAGSLFLLLFGGKIAEGISGTHYSALIVIAMSPAVALRSVSAVFLGYFQGEGSELPTAAAGILRQIFILGFGYMFSKILGGYGQKVGALLMQENYAAMYSGVGFAIAVSLSELFIVTFLTVIYKGSSRGEKRSRQDAMYTTDSVFDCIRYLCAARWPQLSVEFLGVLPLALGLFLYGRSGEADMVAAEYGMYAGKYLAVCGIGASLISIAAIPVVGKIFMSLRREEPRTARAAFQGGVHICVVHGIFISVFTAVMGGQILDVLCPESGEDALRMLLGGSFLIVFTAVAVYFGRFLQKAGKKLLVLGAVGIADIVFAVLVMITLGLAKAGILSLVYGGMGGMLVLCVLLGIFSYRQMRMRMDWLHVLIVPLGAGGVAGLLCALLGRAVSPHLGSPVTLLVTFAAAGAVYWALLLLLRNFREQELDIMMGGRLVSALGQFLHIY